MLQLERRWDLVAIEMEALAAELNRSLARARMAEARLMRHPPKSDPTTSNGAALDAALLQRKGIR